MHWRIKQCPEIGRTKKTRGKEKSSDSRRRRWSSFVRATILILPTWKLTPLSSISSLSIITEIDQGCHARARRCVVIVFFSAAERRKENFSFHLFCRRRRWNCRRRRPTFICFSRALFLLSLALPCARDRDHRCEGPLSKRKTFKLSLSWRESRLGRICWLFFFFPGERARPCSPSRCFPRPPARRRPSCDLVLPVRRKVLSLR